MTDPVPPSAARRCGNGASGVACPIHPRPARKLLKKSKKHTAAPELSSQPKLSEADQNRLLDEFAGSWQSDEDGTELAHQIRESRYFRDRDVEL